MFWGFEQCLMCLTDFLALLDEAFLRFPVSVKQF